MLLPEVATWLFDFESEFFGFPLTTYADQVDSVTQYLQWARQHSGMIESAGAGLIRESVAQLPALQIDGGADLSRSESMEGFIT